MVGLDLCAHWQLWKGLVPVAALWPTMVQQDRKCQAEPRTSCTRVSAILLRTEQGTLLTRPTPGAVS